MRLILKNFRCHESKTIELPDVGLTLLTGQSGIGKTTILNAIAYVLYGQLRKPYSHGKTTCSVTLEYVSPSSPLGNGDDGESVTVITRTSRPNRLVVTYDEVEYEDDAAQGIIDNLIGMNYGEFMASSYIVQSIESSVLSMTPTEGIQFIETLAFHDNYHVEVKKRIREYIKTTTEKVNTLTGEVSVLQRQVDEFASASDEDIVEIEGLSSADEIHATITSLEKNIDKITKQIKSHTADLQKAREKEEEVRKASEKRRQLEIEKSQLERMRSELTKPPPEDELRAKEEELNKIDTWITLQGRRALLDRLKKQYVTETAVKVKELQSKILGDDEVAQLTKITMSVKTDRKAADAYSDAHKKKSNAHKVFTEERLIAGAFVTSNPTELITLLQEQISQQYTCPSCSVTLALCDDQLVIANKTTLPDDISFHEPTGLFKSDASNYLYDITSEAVVAIWDEEKGTPRVPKIAEIKSLRAHSTSRKYYYEDILGKTGKMTIAELTEIISQLTSTSSSESLHGSSSQSEPDDEESVNVEKVRTSIRRLQAVADDFDIVLPPKVEIDMMEVMESGDKLYANCQLVNEIKSLEEKLRRNEYPQAIVHVEDEIVEEEKSYPAGYSIPSDDDIATLRLNLETAWRTSGEYKSLSKDIENKTRLLKCYASPQEPSMRLQLIIDLETTISDCHAKLATYNKEMKILLRREASLREAERREALVSELEETSSTLKKEETLLSGAHGLEEASKQAEILAVERTIESINEYASTYLAEMFEEQIIVRLESFKKSKAGEKPMMNVSIEYKGNTYTSVDELSGGERQRCNLAFLLAVNDLLGSPILMLDECINNLDAEVNSEVLDVIKSHCSNKLVLVVSHEAVHGVFDHVINV